MRSMDALVAVTWTGEARREIPARSNGRRLVLDYFATRCCGSNVSIGDVHLRWTVADAPIGPEFLRCDAPGGVEAFVQQDLVPVLEAARGRIAMRARGWFRHPIVEFEDGTMWLDFIGACRTRSPLRH